MPESVLKRAAQQVAEVEKWLQPGGKIEQASSAEKYADAQARFEIVKKALADGQFHVLRQNLFHPDFWTIFVKLDEYPHGLWYDRTPLAPGEL